MKLDLNKKTVRTKDVNAGREILKNLHYRSDSVDQGASNLGFLSCFIII